MSRVHISKNKRCFNVKSSTYYFHMKTKILAYPQICISVPLTLERTVFLKNFKNFFYDVLVSFEKIFPGNI